MKNQDLKQEDYLGIKKTNCLKGIFAILVILCHVWGRVALTIDTSGFIVHNLGRVLTIAGYLSVAVFFFLSGYGLMFQYQSKGMEYVKQFPKRNILSLYMVNVLLIVIYAIYRFFVENYYNVVTFLKSFLFGETIIINGWYLQAILILYTAFYCVFRFVRSDKFKLIIMACFLLCYCCLCYFCLGLTSTWFESVFAFLLGMVWKYYQEQIDGIFQRRLNYIFGLSVSFIFFLCTCLFGAILGGVLGILCKILSAICFCILVILLVMKVKIENVVTLFLGNIYLELYLLQGLFLSMYKSAFLNIANPFFYGGAVLISTILLAYITHPAFKWIIHCFKNSKKEVSLSKE